MNNKIVFIGLGILIIFVLTIVFIQNKGTNVSPSIKINSSIPNSSKSISSQVLQEYSDPAGFKFNFSKTATISAVDTTDEKVYSSLLITSSKNKGKMTIEVVSSTLTTLDSLIKSKKDVTNIKFADLTAKQFAEKGNIITLALDKGVLFTLTAIAGDKTSYWKEMNDKVISSFVFIAPEKTQIKSDTTPSTSDSSDSDVSFEGEETIE